MAGERYPAARPRRGDRGHGRRDRALVRPAVPVPRLAARRGQVRPDPAAEPGPAAGYRRGGHRGPAADHRRVRQPMPGHSPGRALLTPGVLMPAEEGLPVTEAVAAVLTSLGADTVFGVVGSGNFKVTNALIGRGARYLAARHEGGAAVMADAWARMSGRPGILSVHQGPGLTNAMTGITEAAKSRTPLVVLAADVASAAVRSNFRIDVAALATSVGATAFRLHSPGFAVDDTVRAYRTAAHDRRTVVLALPLDVQAGRCELPAIEPLGAAEAVQPSPAAVASLADALRGARQPVFIAGRGARIAGAGPDLERLADRCGALLATSAAGKGLFRGSPWDLDVSGGFASPLAAELIFNADLVVGWGCSLNMWTLRHGKLIGPDADVVQVDHEPDAIGAHQSVQFGVTGDVGVTARAVSGLMGGEPDGSDIGYRSAALRHRIAGEVRWRDVPYD